MGQIFLKDARKLSEEVPERTVDLIITSPPYFDMKDYGSDDQIGYGQNYKEYLEDLGTVFDAAYKVTKDTGSLWVIIDTFKRDGSVVTLPFDFANVISRAGWRLQDIIIWKKDRTVPWTQKGATRKIFEYVLFFSKSNQFKYYADRVREVQDLKEWWVRYPERYSPKGKSLEEIWEFGIPRQGSWGSNYVRHFCPLPAGLVQRIIMLASDEGDVVLDPFSGSGTVPAQSAFMNRDYIGFEINENYVRMFHQYLDANYDLGVKEYKRLQNQPAAALFSQLIVELRVLKFARQLSKKLSALNIEVANIHAEKLADVELSTNEIVAARYILFAEHSTGEQVGRAIEAITTVPPLSKYGIRYEMVCVDTFEEFREKISFGEIYCYSKTNTHQYKSSGSAMELSKRELSICSPIKLNVQEELYRS